MRLEDYFDADPERPDRFYARTAAVIEGYEFDRVAYKIAGSTYRSTDLTHWLALDMAAQALADAGFPMGEGLPRERTGVIVGNTLTGEFARANQLRLRWPYVRRMVAAALKEQGWDDDQLATFLDGLRGRVQGAVPGDRRGHPRRWAVQHHRRPHLQPLRPQGRRLHRRRRLLLVAAVGRHRLQGAGRRRRSTSPWPAASTCPSTRSRSSASPRPAPWPPARCASTTARSNGFWPGEGCGMVVLMREADARARRATASTPSIAGWGISSDGKGGITRPEVERLPARAAPRLRAGRASASRRCALFEGHGTGTAVGDATELTALSEARRQADPAAPPPRSARSRP